jgi:hypothetical protein
MKDNSLGGFQIELVYNVGSGMYDFRVLNKTYHRDVNIQCSVDTNNFSFVLFEADKAGNNLVEENYRTVTVANFVTDPAFTTPQGVTIQDNLASNTFVVTFTDIDTATAFAFLAPSATQINYALIKVEYFNKREIGKWIQVAEA